MAVVLGSLARLRKRQIARQHAEERDGGLGFGIVPLLLGIRALGDVTKRGLGKLAGFVR